MKFFYKTILFSCFNVLMFLCFNGVAVAQSNFPLKANFFLKWELTESQARELSKWDLLILDMEIQANRPDLLKKIKQLHPDIILLAYITPQEIKKDSASSSSVLRRKFAAGISSSWYLKNRQGAELNWWPGTTLLNVTDSAPLVGGRRFNQYLPEFVAKEILSTGLWDGVFYDNAWDSITHFIGADVDMDGDGAADSDADEQWVAGMKKIYNTTRSLSGGSLVIGNGTTRAYTADLNGKLMENFSPSFWEPIMATYKSNFQGAILPRVNIINANTSNTGELNNYKKMRFGLTSALLENGYYSFDYGDQDHGQLWWYDEYNVDLGPPVSLAVSQSGSHTYKPDVWQRDFGHGMVVVNSTNDAQIVDLGGDYEKLRGKQDALVNDGSIVSELNLAGKDGQLLLKTFATINDAVFRNGDFIRFLRPDGSKARNGFFVFESGYEGGVQLAHIDLDGNGARDLLVVSRGKLEAWRDDGLLLIREFPYTADFTGDLRVAVGDFDGDSKRMEVAVAPANGSAQPIKIYHFDGSAMVEAVFPLGKKYKGGLTVALGQNSAGSGRLVVGSGQGKEPKIFIYDIQMKLKKTWLAFERTFLGGINVASGNVDGKPGDEVIVGAGKGKGPIIRVFDFNGKQLYKDFRAYSTVSKSGIEVLAADVDFDGRAEIIAQGSGF
ncbi:MAG: putative glycoside hydrolase [Patescibacteria group bacterium]